MELAKDTGTVSAGAPTDTTEARLISSRRQRLDLAADSPIVGFALSGGGIRSATQCLGLFQSLARLGLLNRLDILSTVSGGSYFGCFYRSLFIPSSLRSLQPGALPKIAAREFDMQAKAANVALADTSPATSVTPTLWLRENGRYLAPGGAGDLLYAIAFHARNWCAAHFVYGTVFLLVGLLLSGIGAWALAQAFAVPLVPLLASVGGGYVWASPWLAVPLLVFVAALVPVGWSYFIGQTPSLRRSGGKNPGYDAAILIFALDVGVLALLYLNMVPTAEGVILMGYVAYVATVALLTYLSAMFFGEALKPPERVSRARNRLTKTLAGLLQVTLIFAGFALVDTLGRTVYAMWTVERSFTFWIGSSAALLLVPVIRNVLPLLVHRDKTAPTWLTLSGSMLASLAGLAFFALLAITWSFAANYVLWDGGVPKGNPGRALLAAPTPTVSLDSTRRITVNPCAPGDVRCEPTATVETPTEPHVGLWIVAVAASAMLAFVISRFLGFINLSSFHRFYASRLTRAYLRASRFAREPSVPSDVTEAAPGDDISFAAYHTEHQLGPIHLINVTVNQTVAGVSELLQRDRKGFGMCVGPEGINFGAASKSTWVVGDGIELSTQCSFTQLEPRLFAGYVDACRLRVEKLSIGEWCGISGAAFGTGFGQGTSLGLSMLMALTNLRLGYWWNSERLPAEPPPVRLKEGLFTWLARAILCDGKPLHGWRQQSDATCLSQFECGARILVHERLLDRCLGRLHGADDRRQALVEFAQAEGEAFIRVRRDHARGDVDQPHAVALDDTPACAAQSRVDADEANRFSVHGPG